MYNGRKYGRNEELGIMETGKPEKVESLYITFQSEDDIIHFVDTCNEFDDAIDIRIQKMAMDAKSLLGMMMQLMLCWKREARMQSPFWECSGCRSRCRYRLFMAVMMMKIIMRNLRKIF